MSQFVNNVQVRIKNTSAGFFTFVLKLTSGLLLGLTIALVGEEMIGYGNVSFTFIIVIITGSFLRISRPWGVVGVVTFNLICVMLAMLLRMYILIAPGA